MREHRKPCGDRQQDTGAWAKKADGRKTSPTKTGENNVGKKNQKKRITSGWGKNGALNLLHAERKGGDKRDPIGSKEKKEVGVRVKKLGNPQEGGVLK